jgi:hypothetical protein
MFAKQIALAALTLSIAGGAFAQVPERNVFDSEAALNAQNAGAGSAIVALFKGSSRSNAPVASANGLTREQVRAEVVAAREKGELNPVDTETDLRVPAGRVAPAAYAKR